jgi:hypothetical protein
VMESTTITIEELIRLYQTETYSIWKYTDIHGNTINQKFVFDTHADYLDRYLGYYKELPDFTELIVNAAGGIFKLTNGGVQYFIRHNHQQEFTDNEGFKRGISLDIIKEVRNNLIMQIGELHNVKNFDNVVELVTSAKVKGFGELAIYDTSVRIASRLNIEPDKVYLHAGSRTGVLRMEEKGYFKPGTSKRKFIDITELPKPVQVLKPLEAEHMFCCMKTQIATLEDYDNTKYLQ